MKKIFFFTVITFLTLSFCRKEAATLAKDQTVAESQFQENSAQSAHNNMMPRGLEGIIYWIG